MVSEKNRIFTFKNGFFFDFLENRKKGNFVSQISPWKLHLQKKRSRPRRSRQKMQENCNLRFLIFEILSQRFFDLKYPIFSFFQNSKITNFTKLDSQIAEPSRTPWSKFKKAKWSSGRALQAWFYSFFW